MSSLTTAEIEACRFLRGYYDEMGAHAPAKGSREEQHAIRALAAYIAARALLQKDTPHG
jgi:hypothetical protein